MSLTLKRAKQAVQELQDAVNQWDKWVPTEEQKVAYDGRPVKAIGEQLKDQMILTCNVFRTKKIDEPVYELALAVDKFYRSLMRWLNDMKFAKEATNPGGDADLWDAYQGILAVVNKRRPPAPPTPDVLLKQGATVQTIAKRLGWRTKDGRLDINRVNEELAAPASEKTYDPMTWVHPRERKFANQIKAEFEDWCKRFDEEERMNTRPPRESLQLNTPSIEELAEMPNISERNIAVRLGITEDEVKERLADLGYIRVADGFRRANEPGYKKRGDVDPEWLKEHDPHDECGMDVEARIVACFKDGMTRPKSIADLLHGSRNLPVTARQVATVIKKFKAQQKEPVTA